MRCCEHSRCRRPRPDRGGELLSGSALPRKCRAGSHSNGAAVYEESGDVRRICQRSVRLLSRMPVLTFAVLELQRTIDVLGNPG